ncbi:1-acyl-sn-glycerol-3-phosphate acyltransferase [Saccharophagus degradans]|uniref:lysophospholipid acyltransferase family protein n=1 Tax=Saccharophagus degradans TaxID=86304 RepID=UPI001C099F2D|nr:lysophospholipid acyltransferase family protein [Saccharophagus degradans]MBU2986691.1 1-acyl-sn-glycerol-3-phosphate acyltransferase [Saccharophagus degradans]
MSSVRNTVFTIVYALSVIFYGTLSLTLYVLPTRARHKIISTWTNFIIWWLKVSCNISHKLVGAENIKNLQSPVVVMSKHQSAWETFFLQTIFWPSSTILKKELVKIPFFGWGLLGLNPIPIDRSNPREALKQVKAGGLKRIEDGYNLIIFPEGTRLAPGERIKYARSGADIAVACGADVIPVAHNAGTCWPARKKGKIAGMIDIHIGQPISTVGKTSKQVIDEVENWIESTMETLPLKQA